MNNFDLSPKQAWKKQRDTEAQLLKGIRISMYVPEELPITPEEHDRFKSAVILWVSIIGCVVIMTIAGCHTAHAEKVDMAKIAMIESSGCKHKVGDDGNSTGCYQVSKGALAEYNQFNHKHVQTSDLLNDRTCYAVANWYMNTRIPQMLRHNDIDDTLVSRLWAYNAGIGNVVKCRMPKITAQYIAKYRRAS